VIKVLIVDDEPKIRRGLESLIKNIDDEYIVDVAENGEIALEKIHICKTDIVFTDIKMPGMDGLTFMAAAKKLNDDLEFVVVSGYAEFEFAQQAMAYGAIHYILKPVMPDQIRAVLDKAVTNVNERKAEKGVIAQLKERLLLEYINQPPEEMDSSLKPFKGSSFAVAVGKIPKTADGYVYSWSEERRKTIKEEVGLQLAEVGMNIIALKEDEIVVLVNLNCMLGKEFCVVLLNRLESIGNMEFICSPIKALQSPKDIKAAYQACQDPTEESERHSEISVDGGIVAKVILYVKQHYTEKITLAEVADSVYMHPTSVSKIFKKETGITLSEFIVTYRIKKAKEFLCNPAYKVYDVADMVGFSGSKYFINVFKSKTGMTPNEFRNKNIH